MDHTKSNGLVHFRDKKTKLRGETLMTHCCILSRSVPQLVQMMFNVQVLLGTGHIATKTNWKWF